jgi:hypothetical protein
MIQILLGKFLFNIVNHFFLFNCFNRADNIIIQSYEEQLDNRRLYVAVFIKDPYRQDIALTNDQFLLALKRNQQQLYQDIQHHV